MRTIALVCLWMSMAMACGGDDGDAPMPPDADLSLPLFTGEVYDACADTEGSSLRAATSATPPGPRVEARGRPSRGRAT